MKIGLSTYSLAGAFRSGILDFPSIVTKIAEFGGEHVEVVPLGSDFTVDTEMVDKVLKASKDANIPLSSYTFGANFLLNGDGTERNAEQVKAEIDRVKRHIDVAAKLGVPFARHDAGSRPVQNTLVEQFDKDLPLLADACGEVADYAAQYGITTAIENHGKHIQGKERVRRLVLAVNRVNFRSFIDVGNVCGIDEDPIGIVTDNMDICCMFHFKDNYLRKYVPDPENWSQTSHGNYVKGSITGYGDLDLPRIVSIIKKNGFDGFVSIEFEGREESLFAAKRSLDNVKHLFRGNE